MNQIRAHTLLPEGVDRTVRAGWRPGCPLILLDEALSLPPKHANKQEITEQSACQVQCTTGRHYVSCRFRGQHESFVWLVSSALLSLFARLCPRDVRIRAPLHTHSVEEAVQQGGGRGRSGSAWPAARGVCRSHGASYEACEPCNCTIGGTRFNAEELVRTAA